MGQINSGRRTLVGNAGEYYVVAELLKREVIAGLAPRNTRGFDIFAMKDGKTVMVRVKTKSDRFDHWQWVAKPTGDVFLDLMPKGDFTFLVNLAQSRGDMVFYVMPTSVLDGWLKEGHQSYIATPGRNGQPHKDTNKRGISYAESSKELEQYREAWDSLWD